MAHSRSTTQSQSVRTSPVPGASTGTASFGAYAAPLAPRSPWTIHCNRSLRRNSVLIASITGARSCAARPDHSASIVRSRSFAIGLEPMAPRWLILAAIDVRLTVKRQVIAEFGNHAMRHQRLDPRRLGTSPRGFGLGQTPFKICHPGRAGAA